MKVGQLYEWCPAVSTGAVELSSAGLQLATGIIPRGVCTECGVKDDREHRMRDCEYAECERSRRLI